MRFESKFLFTLVCLFAVDRAAVAEIGTPCERPIPGRIVYKGPGIPMRTTNRNDMIPNIGLTVMTVLCGPRVNDVLVAYTFEGHSNNHYELNISRYENDGKKFASVAAALGSQIPAHTAKMENQVLATQDFVFFIVDGKLMSVSLFDKGWVVSGAPHLAFPTVWAEDVYVIHSAQRIWTSTNPYDSFHGFELQIVFRDGRKGKLIYDSRSVQFRPQN